ncbi:MAG: hypothetical protein ABW019_04895, partial [Chitinophagaceae bacterium]
IQQKQLEKETDNLLAEKNLFRDSILLVHLKMQKEQNEMHQKEIPEILLTTLAHTDCDSRCGEGHYSMRGDIVVLSQEEIDNWLSAKPRFN